MRWLLLLLLAMLVLSCGDDETDTRIDAAAGQVDAAAGQVDAAAAVDATPAIDVIPDRDAFSADCLPSGECSGGPACGTICCDLGERCVAGECTCGLGNACTGGDICTSGPQPKDGCGTVCCGESNPCPP